jgi:hypothetical protein
MGRRPPDLGVVAGTFTDLLKIVLISPHLTRTVSMELGNLHEPDDSQI